jgi:DNA topoisomerase I
MPLVIVESQAKGKKIKEYLGAGFDVAASFGHVSDLPEKELGVNPPDFRPTYVMSDRGKKVIANLKSLAAKHNNDVYLATDLDREGEAIAWHLATILKLKDIKRVVFPEITKSAVLQGIANARALDMNTVRGQESRRVLDRFVGYLPTLSIYSKFGSGNSAGRVQSIGLRLVVERDLAIEAFRSIEHYNVHALFNKDGMEFSAEWLHPFKRNATEQDEQDHGDGNKSKYLTNKDAADKMANAVNTAPFFSVTAYDTQEATQSAPCPFTTILMQQAAGKRFGWSAKKTMEVAQKLYEEGLITYHRTDSKDLSDEAIAQIRDFISAFQTAKGLTGLLPAKPNKFAGSANAQEAHEAIRPSNINNDGSSLAHDQDAQNLYALIRARTITSQLSAAKYLVTTVALEHDATRQPFRLTGRQVTFKGWRLLMEDDTVEEEAEAPSSLPDLQNVSKLEAVDAQVKTSKTKPPARMKETELIAILDRKGIGRPSTMATICAVNLSRGYILLDEKSKTLTSSEKGRAVCQWLIQHFSFIEYDYSAGMEKGIDLVMAQKMTYLDFVREVYEKVSGEVKAVNLSDSTIKSDSSGNIIRETYQTAVCPTCKAQTLTRYPSRKKAGSFFWGCSENRKGCAQGFMGDVNGVPVELAKRAS